MEVETKYLKGLDEETVERLMHQTKDELKATLAEAIMFINEKRLEMESHEEFRKSKEVVDLFRSGLREATKEHVGVVRLAKKLLLEMP